MLRPARCIRSRKVPCTVALVEVHVHDEAELQATSLDRWWSDLSPAQRELARQHSQTVPMSGWMVNTLRRAGVRGLVDLAILRDDLVAPCVLMPGDVGEFINCRRADVDNRAS